MTGIFENKGFPGAGHDRQDAFQRDLHGIILLSGKGLATYVKIVRAEIGMFVRRIIRPGECLPGRIDGNDNARTVQHRDVRVKRIQYFPHESFPFLEFALGLAFRRPVSYTHLTLPTKRIV